MCRGLRPDPDQTEGKTFPTPYSRIGVDWLNTRPMENTLATLLPAPLACCRRELEQRRMTPPSNFVLRIVVEEDPKLVRTLNAHYADAAPDGGLDTAERDALLDVVGRHFIERLWPRSGGIDATRRF